MAVGDLLDRELIVRRMVKTNMALAQHKRTRQLVMVRLHFIEHPSKDREWELVESGKIVQRIRSQHMVRQFYTRVGAPVFKQDGRQYYTCYSAQEVLRHYQPHGIEPI